MSLSPAPMSQAFWAERDTTPDRIESALRELLRERHASYPNLAPARVLNMIVVVDHEWKGEIVNRLERAGRYHASRTVLCAVERGRTTLDARAVTVGDERPDGNGGVMREEIEIDLGPKHMSWIDTVIDPIVVSELPTVLWCPHGHHEAARALLRLADVILVDSDDDPEPGPAFARAVELLRSVYVVDLAWLRTTPWRERVAASFDPPGRREAIRKISGLAIRHRPESAASALLLAGWMASRLQWEARPLESSGGTGLRGAARHRRRDIDVELEPRAQDSPGLAGVSVSVADGFCLSLDRGSGGLRAHRRSSDGRESSWRVLGASRGEGGILGEGIRQALLRDPTYGPALGAALGFRPV